MFYQMAPLLRHSKLFWNESAVSLVGDVIFRRRKTKIWSMVNMWRWPCPHKWFFHHKERRDCEPNSDEKLRPLYFIAINDLFDYRIFFSKSQPFDLNWIIRLSTHGCFTHIQDLESNHCAKTYFTVFLIALSGNLNKYIYDCNNLVSLYTLNIIMKYSGHIVEAEKVRVTLPNMMSIFEDSTYTLVWLILRKIRYILQQKFLFRFIRALLPQRCSTSKWAKSHCRAEAWKNSWSAFGHGGTFFGLTIVERQ